MAALRHPVDSKERTDEIADLISATCDKLVQLSSEWFELNDKAGLMHARQMLGAKEVTLMLSAHVDESGLAHIALNLLRTKFPMPRPYFEVRAPMLPWTLDAADATIDAAMRGRDGPLAQDGRRNTRAR